MTLCNQIFKSSHYVATEMLEPLVPEPRLIVQSARIIRGTMLKGTEAQEWIDAIKNAVDPGEANALCRAVYNQKGI